MTSTTVAIEAVDVILRDGTTLRLRPPGEADRKPLVEFFEGLDSRSLYLRFHGHPTVDERLVEPVLEPDWIERGALLGSAAAAGEDRVVALANYVRLRNPTSAEIAFTVADAFVGSIVGTRVDLREVFELHAAGKTRVIRETRSLGDVNEAIADVEAGRVPARIVFTPERALA